MRALTIAVALFLLSASISIVQEAYGGGQGMQAPSYGEPTGLVSALQTFKNILKGALLFGHAIAGISPYPLPSALVVALDGIAATAYTIALAQFIRGVPGGGIE